MSFTGIIKDGVIVLPSHVQLPEGAEVEVVLRSMPPPEDPFVTAVSKTSRPRPRWPQDYALNHGHYVSGEPRKS
jgi:hypothetical protein